MCAGHDRRGLHPGGFRQTLSNLAAGDHPFPTRVKLVAEAYWRRVTRQQLCCGYYGEPGC